MLRIPYFLIFILFACAPHDAKQPDGGGEGEGEGAAERARPELAGLRAPCTDGADCAFACTTDYCGDCACDGIGIRADQREALHARKQALVDGCEANTVRCALWPDPPETVCVEDRCEVDWRVPTAAFDTLCETDDDCVVVFRDFCNPICPCADFAIAKTSLEAWEARGEALRFYCPPNEELGLFCSTVGYCGAAAACTEGVCSFTPQ